MERSTRPHQFRIGIDLGGTKIAAILMDQADHVVRETRIPTPRNDYDATLDAIASLAAGFADIENGKAPVGIAMPGSIDPATGLVQNANSTWLNDRPFARDVAQHLARQVRCANDANCFCLSEAHDGAAHDASSVFGVILGTGCGGALVVDGRLINGPRNIGGEWGHNPLPWPTPDEYPGPECWCGRRGCMETWVSGPGLSADFQRKTGVKASGEDIVKRADAADPDAVAALQRHTDRLARGLAHVVNIIDPDVIVLGGGLSALSHLYRDLPDAIAPHIFSANQSVDIRPPKWGDASGVRGAARLWQH